MTDGVEPSSKNPFYSLLNYARFLGRVVPKLGFSRLTSIAGVVLEFPCHQKSQRIKISDKERFVMNEQNKTNGIPECS